MLREIGDEEWFFIYPHSAFSTAIGAGTSNLSGHLHLHPRSRLRGRVDGQHVSYGYLLLRMKDQHEDSEREWRQNG